MDLCLDSKQKKKKRNVVTPQERTEKELRHLGLTLKDVPTGGRAKRTPSRKYCDDMVNSSCLESPLLTSTLNDKLKSKSPRSSNPSTPSKKSAVRTLQNRTDSKDSLQSKASPSTSTAKKKRQNTPQKNAKPLKSPAKTETTKDKLAAIFPNLTKNDVPLLRKSPLIKRLNNRTPKPKKKNTAKEKVSKLTGIKIKLKRLQNKPKSTKNLSPSKSKSKNICSPDHKKQPSPRKQLQKDRKKYRLVLLEHRDDPQFAQLHRKKLRSEISDESELWEGFPVDIRMPRLKPISPLLSSQSSAGEMTFNRLDSLSEDDIEEIPCKSLAKDTKRTPQACRQLFGGSPSSKSFEKLLKCKNDSIESVEDSQHDSFDFLGCKEIKEEDITAGCSYDKDDIPQLTKYDSATDTCYESSGSEFEIIPSKSKSKPRYPASKCKKKKQGKMSKTQSKSYSKSDVILGEGEVRVTRLKARTPQKYGLKQDKIFHSLPDRYVERRGRPSNGGKDLLNDTRLEKNACILWSSEQRRRFQQQHNELSSSELDELMRNAWKELKDKEKLRYFSRAKAAVQDRAIEKPEKGKKKKSIEDNDPTSIEAFRHLPPDTQDKLLERKLLELQKKMDNQDYQDILRKFYINYARSKFCIEKLMKQRNEHSEYESQDRVNTMARRLLFAAVMESEKKLSSAEQLQSTALSMYIAARYNKLSQDLIDFPDLLEDEQDISCVLTDVIESIEKIESAPEDPDIPVVDIKSIVDELKDGTGDDTIDFRISKDHTWTVPAMCENSFVNNLLYKQIDYSVELPIFSLRETDYYFNYQLPFDIFTTFMAVPIKDESEKDDKDEALIEESDAFMIELHHDEARLVLAQMLLGQAEQQNKAKSCCNLDSASCQLSSLLIAEAHLDNSTQNSCYNASNERLQKYNRCNDMEKDKNKTIVHPHLFSSHPIPSSIRALGRPPTYYNNHHINPHPKCSTQLLRPPIRCQPSYQSYRGALYPQGRPQFPPGRNNSGGGQVAIQYYKASHEQQQIIQQQIQQQQHLLQQQHIKKQQEQKHKQRKDQPNQLRQINQTVQRMAYIPNWAITQIQEDR